MKQALTVIALAALLGGCGSFSGLDGSSSFTCKAPDGVSCTSVSGVYANSAANNLPSSTGTPVDKHDTPSQSDNPHTTDTADKAAKPAAAKPLPSYGAIASLRQGAPTSGDPVLSPPRILRIWLSPWEDQDGDLRDQSYLYVMWNRGEWNIQHSRSNLMNQYAPVSLLLSPGSLSSNSAKETPQQEAPSLVEKVEDKSAPEAGDAH
ncbi:MAG: type IV conjugative transfer system lipoprotein TraV [Thiobacillaceae bacterium]